MPRYSDPRIEEYKAEYIMNVMFILRAPTGERGTYVIPICFE